MRRLALLPLLPLLPLAVARPLAAQDSHYWSETYGSFATLLGGAVVGKVPDLSATFYNPGRLAFAQSPAFALTTHVYQINSYGLDINGTNYGKVQLGNTGVSPSPSFAAGLLPVGDRRRWVVAYSMLTRQSEDQTINANAIATPPGTTAAELYWRRTVSDYWTGLSAGYRLSARTGLGVTLFGTYRSQSQRAQLRAQSGGAPPPPTASEFLRQFNYYDVRLLAKAGISTQAGPWYFGASVTTPGVHVFGSGKILTSEVATGATPLFAWRSQEDLTADYRTPWSVAAGLTRTFGRVTAYGSAEWFAAVPRYQLLDADSVVPTDGRPPYDDDVWFERRSVLAWGLGLELRHSETRAAYLHFTADPSSRPTESGVDATYDRWGRFHAGGGYAFRVSRWDLIAGLVYSWGSSAYTAGEADPPPIGIPLPAGGSAKLSDKQLRFLFGFNVRF